VWHRGKKLFQSTVGGTQSTKTVSTADTNFTADQRTATDANAAAGTSYLVVQSVAIAPAQRDSSFNKWTEDEAWRGTTPNYCYNHLIILIIRHFIDLESYIYHCIPCENLLLYRPLPLNLNLIIHIPILAFYFQITFIEHTTLVVDIFRGVLWGSALPQPAICQYFIHCNY
jgi:hypothetical protein